MLTADLALTPEDRAAIAAAVADAEARTAGEIVPVLATSSDEYAGAQDRAGMVAAALALILLFLFRPASEGAWETGGPGLVAALAALLLGYAAGRALAYFSLGFRRFFVRRADMRDAVERGAAEAFGLFRVRATTAATGVVIYVSLYEGLVAVLGDHAIAAKLSADDWEAVRRDVTDGIARGEPAEGFCAAIRRAGDLLATHFPIGPDDENELTNELTNELRILP